MRSGRVLGLAFAVVAGACVRYVDARVGSQTTVAQSVQVAASAPRLGVVPDVPSVPGARVDAGIIHATLDRHGHWLDDGTYGLVWVPDADAASEPFVPYGTAGRWTLTDAGWYWQSDYAWGWLTFHYGRWVSVGEQWAWVPGAMFAPAWVDWRSGDGWVGWAPLPPRGAVFSAPYVYCRGADLARPDLWSVAVYGAQASSLYATTHSQRPTFGIGGAIYAWGPPPAFAAGASAMPVVRAWTAETRPATSVAPPAVAARAVAAGRAGMPVGGATDGRVAARPVGGSVEDRVSPAAVDGDPRAPVARHPSVLPLPPPDGGNGGRAGSEPWRPSGGGRFARLPDTVVLRGAVARGPLRATVSLGTTGPTLPPASEIPSPAGIGLAPGAAVPVALPPIVANAAVAAPPAVVAAPLAGFRPGAVPVGPTPMPSAPGVVPPFAGVGFAHPFGPIAYPVARAPAVVGPQYVPGAAIPAAVPIAPPVAVPSVAPQAFAGAAPPMAVASPVGPRPFVAPRVGVPVVR